MRIFLSGPMRKRFQFNFAAFADAAAKLRALGHEVISPSEMDLAHGLDPRTLPDSYDWSDVPEWFDLPAAMSRDIEAIHKCDAIYMMVGWQESEGAKAELGVAKELDLPVYDAAVQPPPATLPAPAPAPLKDSGKREAFATGSVRDTREGKGRYDLLSPIVMLRDAQHMENGARKYGERNYELGQPLGRYVDSAMRHIQRFLEGHRDEDHLAAARWNIGALMHTEEMVKRGRLPVELNDLPNYLPKGGGR